MKSWAPVYPVQPIESVLDLEWLNRCFSRFIVKDQYTKSNRDWRRSSSSSQWASRIHKSPHNSSALNLEYTKPTNCLITEKCGDKWLVVAVFLLEKVVIADVIMVWFRLLKQNGPLPLPNSDTGCIMPSHKRNWRKSQGGFSKLLISFILKMHLWNCLKINKSVRLYSWDSSVHGWIYAKENYWNWIGFYSILSVSKPYL